MNKPILITGCSSGIGLCLAERLAALDYAVVATCRHAADTEKLRAKGFTALTLDLQDSASIRAAVDDFFRHTDGDIFALINNGAYGQPGAIEDLTRAALQQQFETNVFGTQELTNLVIPSMRRQRQGRIIQISSVLGFVCWRFRGAYAASKYALEGLTDTMRLELDGSGVYACLIEPGPIASRFRQNALAAYQTHINPEQSYFKETYRQLEARLTSDKPMRFTLSVEAVFDATLRALRAARPKTRYRVTTPTHAMAILKRLLPDKWLDRVLLSSG